MIAYIPARGGSKRIPGKNIRSFVGIPAIGRVIQGIRSTAVFERIIVSTDHLDIARTAQDFGAEVIERDAILANDHAGLLEVVQRDLRLPILGEDSRDVIACVLPTALLMSPLDLLRATKLTTSGRKDFVVSVGRFSYPIQRALTVDESGQIKMLSPENYQVRSQDLEHRYHDAGQFYVGTRREWMRRSTVFDYPTHALHIEDHRVIDIDVEADWRRAELLWKLLSDETYVDEDENRFDPRTTE